MSKTEMATKVKNNFEKINTYCFERFSFVDQLSIFIQFLFHKPSCEAGVVNFKLKRFLLVLAISIVYDNVKVFRYLILYV